MTNRWMARCRGPPRSAGRPATVARNGPSTPTVTGGGCSGADTSATVPERPAQAGASNTLTPAAGRVAERGRPCSARVSESKGLGERRRRRGLAPRLPSVQRGSVRVVEPGGPHLGGRSCSARVSESQSRATRTSPAVTATRRVVVGAESAHMTVTATGIP